jgi:hypothetical protein
MNIRKKLKTYVGKVSQRYRTVSQRYRQRKSDSARPKSSPSGEKIIGSILNRVAERNTNCSSWCIGITHEPAKRKAHWKKTKNVKDWAQWPAVTLSDALYIEKYFVFDKNMESVTDEVLMSGKPIYVYIF